jgi:Holliday junction resolvasome RuvABC endonuclease subunit
VVGNGNATKEQTRRVVANILKIDPAKLSLDASDALALALGHAYMSRFGQ